MSLEAISVVSSGVEILFSLISVPERSKYATSLESHTKQCYHQKIEKISIDPSTSQMTSLIPSVYLTLSINQTILLIACGA